ncbi:MAG: cyclic pyranopterin monophosphate synthase MoaC [Promethearchaeota archaeon]
MIDISKKEPLLRIARASGKITLREETIKRIKNSQIQKGDVKTIAKISAISAVKKVPDLIPLCHPIPINKVSVDIEFEGENSIIVKCTVKSISKTGVEMEALVGVNIALLNIWDVVKMYEKDEKGQYPNTLITEIKVEEKIKEEPNKR